MKTVRYLFVIVTILITVLAFILLTHAFYSARQAEHTRNEFTVNQKIHLECQKLAAIADESWSYKSCVESIINADKQSARILKTI